MDEAPRPRRSKLLLGAPLLLVLCALPLGFTVCRVEGDSMAPTLAPGARVLVWRWPGSFARGDLVVFEHPYDPRELLIKRVAGLPGEQVDAAGGRLRVDGRPLEEPYLQPGWALEPLPPQRVREGELFLIGDNRRNSVDSRRFGPIEVGRVVGTVID